MATRPRPRLENTSSPPAVCGLAIVVTRIATIIALVAAMGLAAYLASVTSDSQQSLPVVLITILVVTPVAILWTALSWNGYSKKYLPQGTAWALDFIFLVPFASITVLLGLPLSTGRCSDIPPTGSFVLIVPPGTSFGTLSFPGMGQAACNRLLALWGLLAAVCVLFVISALLTSFQQLGTEAIRKGKDTKTAHVEADADFFYRQGQIEMGNVTPGIEVQSVKPWISRSDIARSQQEPGGPSSSDSFYVPQHSPLDTLGSTVGMIPIGLARSRSGSPSATSTSWGQSQARSRSKGKQPAEEGDSYSRDYVLPRTTYDSPAHGTTTARDSGKSSPGWTSHYSSSNYSGDEQDDRPSPQNSPPARLGFDHNRESILQDMPMTSEKRVSHWPSLRSQSQQEPQERRTGGFLRGVRKSLTPQPLAAKQERKSRFSRFVPSGVGGWWDMLPNVLEEPPKRQTNSMPDGPYVQGGQAKFDPRNVV
ncbi:hypothetical protein B0T19DRAFT_436752 [Cercophora scortea]|uniref:MARVEL domain-containing protein n=1 Tax=Cercophora scortea TaxID=314031 RepID=A0AAE0J3M6_9PEZI|nr:hypothetical protein B0T19DRAFT_436752 [Cercophora scortea]